MDVKRERGIVRYLTAGLLLSLSLFPLYGAENGNEKEKGEPISIHRWGLFFDVESLLLDAAAGNDGYQAGIGLKLAFSEAFSLRSVTNFQHQYLELTETSHTYFGLGLGGLWYPLAGKEESEKELPYASPYLGGELGISLLNESTADTVGVEVYGGPVIGAEIALFKYLSLYCEYNLLFAVDENGFSINVDPTDPNNYAPDSMVQAGFIIYFK